MTVGEASRESRPAAVPAAAHRSATAGLWRASVRYWACLLGLAVAAVGVHVLPGALGVYFRKDPVPLKRSLALFDFRQLGPRYVRHPDTDRMTMSEDQIDSLGTREFLTALVTDTRRAETDPLRVAQVLVTYYTGKPDLVPHVPDECYVAGGFEPVGRAETVPVVVPGVGAPGDRVPVRVQQFRVAQGPALGGGGGVLTVMYFFHINNAYASTRDEVRLRFVRDLFQPYAYYTKIEVCFPQSSGLPLEQSRTESLAAVAPLLESLLPVLLREHLDLSKFTTPGAAGT